MIGLHDQCHLVEIREKQPGVPVILLDGHEMRTATAAVLTLGADRPAQLKLALLAVDGMDVTVPARVLLDEETAAALIAMGWTPPGNGGGRPGLDGTPSTAGDATGHLA